MRLDHAIFQSPLKPTIQLHELPTPAGYRHYHAGRALPATLSVWTVQTGELGKSVDYGLVATPGGFEDTPDTEWISGGINSKGPDSVALGRHGNWFLWGFAGDPGQLTDSARQVFLNTLVWMRQFDGQNPEGVAGMERPPAREQMLDYVAFVEAYANEPQVLSWVKQQFPADVWEECAGDAARLREWYEERLGFLRPIRQKQKLDQGGGKFREFEQDVLQVDPLLEHLGVANRSPELFEQIDWLLREPQSPAVIELRKTVATDVPDGRLAETLIERYLPAGAPTSADALKAWLAERKERLYFSDTRGYRWFVKAR